MYGENCAQHERLIDQADNSRPSRHGISACFAAFFVSLHHHSMHSDVVSTF